MNLDMVVKLLEPIGPSELLKALRAMERHRLAVHGISGFVVGSPSLLHGYAPLFPV